MKISNILKVIITGVLLLTLVLSFGACATVTPAPSVSASQSASASAASASAATATPAATTAAPSASPSASDLPTLTMATNAAFPPYEFKDGDNVVGIDAEVAQAVADKIGMKLVISDMEFDSIIPAVVSGKANMGMAAITVTDDRKKNVDFSDVYATGKQVIIVKNDSKVTGPKDLKEKKIGVQLSTTGDIYCTGDYGDKAMQRFNSGSEAVQALMQGKVDAVVIDNEPAKVYVSQNTGLKILETEYITENYAIAVTKGNTALLTKINSALADLKASGALQKIIDKYITAK